MKQSRKILFILLIGSYLLLSGASTGFALFRDDLSKEEIAELAAAARERNNAALEKRPVKTKEDRLESRPRITEQKKQISSFAVPAPQKSRPNLYKKIIISAVLLAIIIAIVMKFRKKQRK